MTTLYPDDIDTWQDPVGGQALVTSPDGRTHPTHHTDLQHAVLNLERQLVGPALMSSDQYADFPAVVLNTAESLSDGSGTWGSAAGHSGDVPSLDAVNFSTGANSVTCDLNVGTSGVTHGKLYVDLPAPITVAPYHTLSVDLRYHLGSGSGTQNKFEVAASDAVALGGTVVGNQIIVDADQVDTWFTWVVGVGSLTTIRSIGLQFHTAATGSSTQWLTYWMDNIRLDSATALDGALAANTGAIIVPSSYVASVSQHPDTFSAVRQVLDLRPARANLAGGGGVYNLRDWRLDETGAEDVTADLQRIIDALPDGSTLVAPPSGIFRQDSTVEIDSTKSNFTFDGRGSRWYQPTAVNRQFFTLDGTENTIKGFRVFSFNSLATPDVSTYASGDSTHPIVGTPTAVGTTVKLDAQLEQVELPWRGPDEVAYWGRDQLGVNRWEFVLYDTNHVADDCKFTVMQPDGTVLQTTTVTLTNTPTTYQVAYVPTNLYMPLRVAVSKATATANVITLASTVIYGRQRYQAILAFNHFVAAVGNSCRVADCWVEGVGGDMVTASGSTGLMVENCVSRVNGRQGFSVTSGTYSTLRNCEILGSAQWSMDFEPNTSNTWMSDILIENSRFIDPGLGSIACTGWGHIRRVHIRNCDFLKTSDRGGVWMDGGWWEGTVENCSFIRQSAGPFPQLEFQGRGVHWSNITSSAGLKFKAGTKLDENGFSVVCDYNSVDGWRAYDPDTLFTSEITNYSQGSMIALDGSYNMQYP